MQGADFFDVDHTITRRSSGRHFMLLGVRRGVFPVSSLLFFPLTYLRYRFFGRKAELPGLKGISLKDIEGVSRESFDESLMHDLYPDALTLIKRFQSSGRRVVLATSSIDFIVKPLADYLGITEMIANSLVFEDGVCTGRFMDIPVFRQEKRKKVLEYIESRGISVEESSFYSDSIHDLPLLEDIGNPVAVNPDRSLKRIAEKRGWEILVFS